MGRASLVSSENSSWPAGGWRGRQGRDPQQLLAGLLYGVSCGTFSLNQLLTVAKLLEDCKTLSHAYLNGFSVPGWKARQALVLFRR